MKSGHGAGQVARVDRDPWATLVTPEPYDNFAPMSVAAPTARWLVCIQCGRLSVPRRLINIKGRVIRSPRSQDRKTAPRTEARAQARASTDAQALSVAHPFLFLRDLEGCWDDEGLKVALFDEMQDPDLWSAQYAALADALLRAGYEPAIADGVARIDLLDESAIAIADVLLRGAPAAVWPLLWRKLLANDALARAVLTQAAGSYYHSIAFYAGIGADAIADLYLLMVRLFPPESDPGVVTP